MIPTSPKIGYPSRNKKRRMKATTTTAKNAVQKNTVFIACSLSKENWAVPGEANLPVPVFLLESMMIRLLFMHKNGLVISIRFSW
jgi:hypothetical protein